MRYLPHTDAELRAMLDRIGVDSIASLFAPIPEAQRAAPLELEEALSEPRLMAHLGALAQKNDAAHRLSFLGGGMYDHHIPPAVDQLLLRSEFYTAYTPYQAEVSQGTLQAIYEFQTMVCELFGQEVANASMYCAASASAEAVLMARRVTRRKKVLISAGIHPEHKETLRTYLNGLDEGQAELEEVPLAADGRTDLEALGKALAENPKGIAAVLIGYPNFFGIVEDIAGAAALAHDHGALLATTTTEVYALSLLKSPGALGADICVGEGQSLAASPQFGGPGVGLFATRQKLVRQMPGRLVGETVDQDGARGFVLTLSTREQHIRRERATSNICTNHGLIALSMAIRTAMLGKTGFVAAGKHCLSNAEYLKGKLSALEGFSLPNTGTTFNEFVLRSETHSAADIVAKLLQKGILAGVDLGRFGGAPSDLLIATTEKHNKADLDALVSALAEL